MGPLREASRCAWSGLDGPHRPTGRPPLRPGAPRTGPAPPRQGHVVSSKVLLGRCAGSLVLSILLAPVNGSLDLHANADGGGSTNDLPLGETYECGVRVCPMESPTRRWLPRRLCVCVGGGDQLVGSTTTSYRCWIAIDRGEERPPGTTTITRVFLTSRSDTSGSYCRELGSRSLWKPSTADGESVAVRQ